MKTSPVTALLGLLLAGCASIQPPTASFNALDASERASDTSGTAKAALEADFQRALEHCDAQMLAMREAFYGSGKTELTIASIGIVAGSIIVPALAAKTAAAKSAIAGWGGVSGAANAAQYTLQQKGVSASRLGAVYEEIRGEIQASTMAYAAATRNSQRIVAVNRLSVACRYPPLPVVEAPAPAAAASAP